MSHRLHLREKMFEQVRRWELSGMTQSQYCREHCLERSRFYYWLKKFRELPDRERSAFLPIIVDERITQPHDDRIVVKGQAGITAFFPMQASFIPLIRQLLQG